MQIDSIRVDGGVCLQGKVRIQGSKNACLPIMAATLLTDGVTILANCPKISDVFQMKQLLGSMGCEIRENNYGMTIDTSRVEFKKMPLLGINLLESFWPIWLMAGANAFNIILLRFGFII